MAALVRHEEESASANLGAPLRARAILLAYLAVDVVFKLAILPAYLDLGFGLGTERCAAAFLRFLPIVGVMVLTWFAGLAALLYPVARWHRTPTEERTPDAIRRIAKTTRRLPQRLGLWWTLEWFALFSTFTMVEKNGPSLAASLFFLSAMMLGPWALGHGLGVSLLGSTVREISLLARAGGVELDARPRRLMPKLAAYCLCIALAPTGYLASLVVNPSTHGLGTDHWIKSVAIFYVAIALFAALSAVLLAQTITKPASEMGNVMRVLIAQGDVSQVARLPVYQRDEVGMLAEQTNRMLDRLESTAKERARTAVSLEALNQTLEERVTRRTEELSIQTREMRLVLDNVAQSLFAVPRSGVLPLEISHSTICWFGVPVIGETFYSYIGRSVPGFERNAEVGWMQVNEDVFPLEIALDQMPKRIEARGKHLRISYEPIANDPDGRILIVITDETSLVEHENAEIERRETLALLDHYISERGVFLEFMEEASSLVARVQPMSSDEPLEASSLKRAIHTLKGNAMSFGIESIARICHEIESAIAENLPASTLQELLSRLDERWQRLENRIERVGGKQRRMVEITPDDHAALENAIRAGVPRQQLMQMVKAMKLEPVSVRLNHLAEQARRISARLDKAVRVDVVDDGLKVDASRWAKLWPAIVHPVRNAIDHGIESATERAHQAKPESGHLVLRSEREGDKIVIAIEDDGRGIEWSSIAAKCRASGIAVTSQEDLTEALFLDGLSTAKSVNDISGRGIGMGALRETVESLGGTLAIVTKPNQGTSLRMAFPAKQEELSSSLRPAA